MITLAKPLTLPAISTVQLVNVSIDPEGLLVTFSYMQIDSAGNPVRGQATMTASAFLTALAATKGDPKPRLYAVFQGLVPAFAGAVT